MKFVNYSNLEFQSGLVVLEPFEECVGKLVGVQGKKRTVSRLNTSLLCEVPRYIQSFANLKDLEDHIKVGNHRFSSEITSMDSVKAYTDLVQTSSHSKTFSAGKTPTVSSSDHQVYNSTLIPHFNKNGWAIPKRQNAFFTLEQRNFLYKEFMISEKTGGKTTTDKVVKKMKTKHTIGGKKLFAPEDYCTCEEKCSI